MRTHASMSRALVTARMTMMIIVALVVARES
jgi:hypothetical protein